MATKPAHIPEGYYWSYRTGMLAKKPAPTIPAGWQPGQQPERPERSDRARVNVYKWSGA